MDTSNQREDDDNQQKQQEDYDHKFKVVMLGDPNAGKTSIVSRYVYNSYEPHNIQSTIGIDVLKKVLLVENQSAKISIWDTGGQDKYSSLTDMYFRKTLGFVLVFDLTDQISFQSLGYWIQKIRDRAFENSVIILVGNKEDDTGNIKISDEQIQKFVEENNIYFQMKASAKEGTNIALIFQQLCDEIVKRIQNNQFPDNSNNQNNQNNRGPKGLKNIKGQFKKVSCC